MQPHGVWARLKELFCSPHAPAIPAVCVPPGALLLVHDIPLTLRREFRLQEAEETVFTQITAAVNSFRDAVRFQNGVEVLLQRLATGQRVRVLALSSAEDLQPACQGQQSVNVPVT